MKGEDPLRTYLTRATRGLGCHKRQEITSELIGHIEARMQDFKLAGLSDAEALRQTLRELGEPEHVHSGMQRVYVWPTALRSGGLLGLIGCAAVIGLLQLGNVLAQVQGYKPSFTPLPGPYTYVDTLSLRDELRKAGVTVTGNPTQPTLTLPGQATPIRVNTLQDTDPPFVSRVLVRDYATGRDYIDLNAVVAAAIQAGVSAWVDGWQNPKLHLGSVTLALGTPDQPLTAYNLYHLALKPLARQIGLNATRSSQQDDIYLYSNYHLTAPPLDQPVQPGDVYALVSVQRMASILGRGRAPTLYFDLAQADHNGQLHFRMPYELPYLKLTGDFRTLQADAQWLNGANPINYASAAHPAHAMILKMNGKLSGSTYQIIPMNALSAGEPY